MSESTINPATSINSGPLETSVSSPPKEAQLPAANESPAHSPVLFSSHDLWFAQILLILITSIIIGYMVFRFLFPNPQIQVIREPGKPYAYFIDINQADWVQWMLLPDVGEKLARKITAYREEHGPFKSVDDLLKINGIGKTTLEHLKPYLKCEIPENNSP